MAVLFRRELGHASEGFGRLTAAEQALLTDLTGAPQLAPELRTPGNSALLDRLWAGGWLTSTVRWEARDLYTIQPLNGGARQSTERPGSWALSRFVVIRRIEKHLVAESPLAHARIEIHDLAVLEAVHESEGGQCQFPRDVRDRIVRDFWQAGLLAEAGSEDASADLAQWSPHELWFHSRSRRGNGSYDGVGYGRTEWARDRFDPVPVERVPFPGPVVTLPVPDLDALRTSDMSLTRAVETRRSIRRHDDAAPITRDQLGEFLYRSARGRKAALPDGSPLVGRPYPGGGGAFELELYPVVRTAPGLAPGLYYYDPHRHQLQLVQEKGPSADRLLRAAAIATVMPSQPQVLLVISARFGRLLRTYEQMAYSTVLKDVGALYQTLYLTATAMGLAGCALGAGDAMAFTEATGLRYETESSVGEFIIGSHST
jgi:SagB-type dehydrogenase family enzyme